MEQFAAARVKRRRPEFANCSAVDDVFEKERIFYSFAISVKYIGKESRTELREYLWGPDGPLDPEVLRGAEFERIEMDVDFRIPEGVMKEIEEKAREYEEEFHRQVKEERERTVEHLRRLLQEKESEGKEEEVKRIREEIERRSSAELPELRVLVEPVALLAINAPLEIHHTKLENEFARREVTWKFDTLTGEHDLRCDSCGRSADRLFLAVDGIACESCIKECKECGKPMINAHECRVCHAPLCDEHVHHCSTCGAELCDSHAIRCEFCSKEMCPEHVNRCSICNAPLCEDHSYSCVVCGRITGPRHTRVCDVCGGNVCPEHIHRCSICGKNVCENCAVQIDGEWYCREHLEVGYGGKLVLPEIRCEVCGIALEREDMHRCEVCGKVLCGDHVHRCSICNEELCDEHVHRCSICNEELCEKHTNFSEISGKPYCESHTAVCEICGRVVGVDEVHGGICDACSRMREISRREVPREIFVKFPYAKRGREWYVSRGKNVAYITEVKGMRLAYRIVDGEIVEHRGKANPKFK